jgi:exopolysaccharide biosynthesis polyprenyl glycosylphosphotransferase
VSRRAWTLLNLGADALAVNAGIVLAFVLRFGWPIPAFNFAAYQRMVVPITVGQLAIFFLVGLYDPAAERSGPESLGTVIRGLLLGVLALVGMSFFLRAFSFPRTVVAVAFFTQVLLLWAWRRAAAGLLHVRWPTRKVIVIGSGTDVGLVVDRVRAAERWGYRVAGVVVEGPDDALAVRGLPVVVGLSELPRLIDSEQPDQVIVATPARHRRIMEEIALSPRFHGEIFVVPQLYEMHLGELDFSLLGDLPVLRMTRPPRPEWRQGLKVLTERVLAVVLLVVLAPLIGLVALAVLLFSGHPVLYRQTRLGLRQKPFTVYKFRTMRRDAEAAGAVLAEEDDPRVTGIGRYLRASRFDEVPQFVNVARGDMSFVGPRPERPEFVVGFLETEPLYVERFQLRPGITGLAQVSGSYATTAAVKLRFDLMYAYHQSLALDIRILLRTVQVVLTGKGAR